MPDALPRPRLRPITAEDAETLAGLADALNRHFDPTAETLDPGNFAPLLAGSPSFLHGLIAENADGVAVGYALTQDFFDTDRGHMALWLLDLYIAPDHRGRGTGRRMLAALARRARGRGMAMVGLAAYRGNPARRLYERIGAALPEEALVYELRDAALDRMADEGEAL